VSLKIQNKEEYFMESVIIGSAGTQMYKNSGRKAIDFHIAAIQLATADAGINPNQIDGIITGGSFIEPRFMYANVLAEKLGIKLRLAGSVDAGGANSISGLILADAAIKNDKASAIVVVDADNVGTFYKNHPMDFFRKACEGMDSKNPKFSDPTKPIVAYMYNEVTEWYAKKFLKKYPDKREILRNALAEVAVVMSRHASKHPFAINDKILTVEDVLDSPKICSWLNVYECARPADGGGAIIITSEKEAKTATKKNKPVYILGSGQSFDHKNEIDYSSDWGCEKAGNEAFAEAGLTVNDLNTAFIYDCFPITVIKALEDLRFCEKLEGPFYVLDGNIEIDKSKCPINTHGGLLSYGAPWAAPSMFGLIEIIKQLQRKAEKRQVKNCEKALAYGNGGCFSASSVVILGN
jgi:acetyl-CoA acetyltransferase